MAFLPAFEAGSLSYGHDRIAACRYRVPSATAVDASGISLRCSSLARAGCARLLWELPWPLLSWAIPVPRWWASSSESVVPLLLSEDEQVLEVLLGHLASVLWVQARSAHVLVQLVVPKVLVVARHHGGVSVNDAEHG